MKVFSKEKFLKYAKFTYHPGEWPDICDGKKPEECWPYRISDVWCIDVPDAVEESGKILNTYFPNGFPKTEQKPEQNPCPIPDYQIIITCWGDTTHADMFVNGHKVKETKAKRNPADKFNFRIGAQTAFNRLWEKKKKPAVQEVKRHAKLGEWVKIVKAYHSGFETYKTGDVLKVKRLFETDEGGWVYLEGHTECACAPIEYVVLEGYKPE